jgi:hypothetical protein
MATVERATGQPGITRTDLQRHDLSVPEREVIQNRVDIERGMPLVVLAE